MWTVWIALLLWAAPTQGVSTTCEIPAVEKLQNTSLTCKFSEDISKRKQDFEVHFYKNNTTDSSETILRCYWMDNKLECRVHSCCEYDGHVTANLTVRVLSVTDTRVGRYVCFVLPASPDGNTFCNFTLRFTDKITDTSGGNLAALAVLVVIPVIICIIIIIIVWRRKCSKKSEDKMMKKKTCHFCPVQRYSKEKETVDGKFNEGKQSLIECKVEENDSSHSKDRSFEKDLKSTDPMIAEKFGQKSDNIDRSQRPVHTSVIEHIRTWFARLFRREPVNQNVELTSKPQQEPSLMKNDPPSTSVTGPETKSEEIEKDQTGVSFSGTIAPVTQLQKMQSPSGQNDVLTPIADKSSDDDTHTTRETSHILGGNEFQTENEAKDQKTQKSDVYNCTTNIEGRKAKSVRKLAQQDEKINDKAEKEIKSAREKAEKEEKIVNENAEKEEKIVNENAKKEEATAERKAEELEKIAKEKAKREERMADEKAKEEEKITKDKAVKEEVIAKRASNKMAKTPANIEEKLKNISNEKEEQMTKIAKRKDEQLEIIAKEKDEQLEKIAKEKREELEKIANAREKRLDEISKRKTEEIDKIKKRKEEGIKKIKYVKKERMERIRNKKEKKMETIYKRMEDNRKKKGKENKHTEVRESLEVQGSDEQSKEKENEDDVCRVEVTNVSDSLLNTTISNDQVNPATMSKSTTDTVIIMSELASLQEISEAP